jgi:hypothetical protein
MSRLFLFSCFHHNKKCNRITKKTQAENMKNSQYFFTGYFDFFVLENQYLQHLLPVGSKTEIDFFESVASGCQSRVISINSAPLARLQRKGELSI